MHTTSHQIDDPRDNSRIGDVFLNSQRLTKEDIERITLIQQTEGLRFGEAAIALGLLTTDEVQRVLSNQFRYPLAHGDSTLINFPIVHAPGSPEAEALRTLRTQILLSLDPSRSQSIAIFSPKVGEGKSYIATSLALAFAQNNQRVLLINANLRLAQNNGLLSSQRQSGLSQILAGRATVEQSIIKDQFPQLSILDAGPLPPNPAELLQAPALLKIIQEVSDRFHIIIVDTPPTTMYPDAQLIAKQVDACLLVVQQHKTLISDFNKAKQVLRAAGGHLLGSIYNAHRAAPPTTVAKRLRA